MRGYKAELIKEIRTRLKNPFDVFFAACILQMLGFPIVIFLAVIVDKYLFSIKYLNILFVLSLFTSVLCAIAIRRLLDHRGVERLDDAEDRGLLSDLPSALHYDSPKILLTTNYLIGLQLGIVIIPYDEILWIYKKVSYLNGGHTNSALVVRTQSGKTLQFGGSTFLTSNLNNKIDEIIQELYRRNPRILLGYEFNKQKLYKSEVSRIRKGGAGASVLPSTPVPYQPDIGSVNDPIIASETDIRPVNDPNITSSTTEPIQTTTTVSFLPQGTAEFIQCWHCKRNNPLGVHFCTFCSQPLTMDAAVAVESAQKPSFSKQAYDTANSGFTYKKLKIVIIVASALLILLAGVIMTLGKFFSGLPTQQELVPCTFVIQEIDYREEYYIADIAREAEGVLCIMKVTITNNNSVPVQIKANQLQVIIGNDTYHANKYLSEKFTYVLSDVYKNELSSGASATAYCVFDIPDSFKYSKDLAVSYEYSDDEIDG